MTITCHECPNCEHANPEDKNRPVQICEGCGQWFSLPGATFSMEDDLE